MRTKKLRKELDIAIADFLPLFEVTKEELKGFQQEFSLTRRGPKDLDNEAFAAYYPILNKFYFPWLEHIRQATIHHEAGHYIHRFVNKDVEKWISTFKETGFWPPYCHTLIELVAEYGNFILKLRTSDELNGMNSYTLEIYNGRDKAYKKHGPKFLPELARMSLEEFVDRKIIPISLF